MIERYLQALSLEDPGEETPAATRERLRDRFPAGATRRMTQLGLLIGSVLGPMQPQEDDALVYATAFGEHHALEQYVASFPTASPSLFQTSIHPSAVQQALIARQQAIHHFFPLTGQAQLVAHAVQTALLAPNPRAILCGGEEASTWLRGYGAASPATFAFALALSDSAGGALGSLGLEIGAEPEGSLALPAFFSALRQRQPLRVAAAPGLALVLRWS